MSRVLYLYSYVAEVEHEKAPSRSTGRRCNSPKFPWYAGAAKATGDPVAVTVASRAASRLCTAAYSGWPVTFSNWQLSARQVV